MIERENRDGVAVVRMAHGKANALDVELLEALDATCRSIAEEGPGALVLTGTGRIFCAGVDLPRLLEGGDVYRERFLAALETVFERFFALPIPAVAAVNGHAIAGGCILAAACDRRVMSDAGGKTGVTELQVGVPFPDIALEVLRHALTPAALRDLVYTRRLIDADEARRIGLVDRIVAEGEVVAAAVEDARQLAAIPSATFAMTKRQLRGEAIARAARQADAHGAEIRALWGSDAVVEQIRRFVELTLRQR